MKHLSYSIILLFLLASCSTPQTLVYRDIEHVRIENVGLDRSTVALDIRYYNPNAYSLDLQGGDIDVYLNDHYIGKGVVNAQTVIPSQKDFILPLSLAASLKSIFQGAYSIITSQTVAIRLQGAVRVGKAGIFLSVPVNLSANQKISVF